MHILIEKKKCSPECKLFKCSKNATIYRRDAVWCRWTDDLCDVANCAYAICIKKRLLPGGICGETIKRRTTDKRPEEVVGPPVKVRGKTLRRIGDKEIF